MRAKERIPIVLEFFKNNEEAYLKFIKQDHPLYHDGFVGIYKILNHNWLIYPDLRFGQLLINEQIIPDSNVWNIEEQEWLVWNNYFKFEDINFWGVNYDKDMNRLENPYRKLLSELDDDHIRNILKFFENRIDKPNEQYLKYFNKRLEKSNGNIQFNK